MIRLFAAGVAAVALAGSAQAVTFFSTAGAPDPGAAANETVLFDFEAATPELTGSFSLVTGTLPNVYAAPAGDETQYAVVPMAGQGMGVATLDVSGVGDFDTFSFYWGSIDTYNTVELLNGDDVIFTLNGSQLPPADGDQGAGLTNRRVFFNLDADESFTSIRFTSDGVAFEFDDIAFGAAVPEPATWGLMIVGFGMVGFAARRRGARSIAA